MVYLYKKSIIFILFLILVDSSYGAEIDKNNKSELILSIRRVGLDFSKTQVRNAAAYKDSPVTALNANSQEYIKGILDTALEYKKDKILWDNGVFIEYAKTTLKPDNAQPISDETADNILFSSGFSYAVKNFSGLKIGPAIQESYETQFTNSVENPRQNIFRSMAGISLFDHEIIKKLYLSGVYEYDFTYAGLQNSKLGAEIGWRLEYLIREGVKISSNGYFREYFDYSEYIPTDLARDLSAVLRLDTNLWGKFTLGPYVQYRLAKARGTSLYGSNLIIGVSFSYINKFLLN